MVSVAHTACVGFGLERITLALLRHHGLDLAAWPEAVRDLALGLRAVTAALCACPSGLGPRGPL